MSGGIGGHHSPKMLNDEWMTPPEIIRSLGGWHIFDLDPCAPEKQPWPTAAKTLTKKEDGLLTPWDPKDLVWMNPPYGKETGLWLEKLAYHGNGIALIFARTETKMFFEFVWGQATSILFIKGRLHFYSVDGKKAKANSGAPSVLVAYGEKARDILHNSRIKGYLINLL